MPLDTGSVVEGLGAGTRERPSGPPPSLQAPGSVGQILRDMRLYRGLDLEDLAQVTRVRANYLGAIEHMRLDLLPSRPFALGYVRAYATALGLDGDMAAARFKVETPDGEEVLRAPPGVKRESDPRLKLLGVGGALVVAAIVAWNIAQHGFGKAAHGRHGSAEVAASAVKPPPVSPPGAPLSLGAPLPAPQESTTPQPYYTPGIEQAMGGASPSDVAEAAAAQARPAGSPFVQKGAIYGADASQSTVIVQARKDASLVVHGADGSVYFARQLAAGEAYRAPQNKGLTIDVSEPEKFDVFVAGALKGPLTGPKTVTTQLAG